VPFLRKPEEMLTKKFWADAKRGISLIFSPKTGVFGSTQKQIFDYLRTDFHPNDHDTTEYLEYYKEKLLASDGAIGPYLTKIFTPPLRAA
jgi:predicted metal-dependent hydrolase